MRVSFDIDDTLVCSDPSVPKEQHLPGLLRPWFPEPLRLGTRSLMRELRRLGCEVCLYTTSYRDPLYLHLWFRALGIPLTRAINQNTHDRVVRRGPQALAYPPSKYPPAFGIHLHVDDLEGVAMEGRAHGFAVVVVRPNDRAWTERVLEAVGRRMHD